MKFCIHRGTHEIGGTCVELESQGKKLILDLGLPLDKDFEEASLPDIRGLTEGDSSLLGIVISHPHQDHYGLIRKIRPEIPILIGPAAQRILEAANNFIPRPIHFQNTIHLRNRTPIVLGPFTITPYLVDHSAYDAYAILVEADGKKLFYSGDLRAHGRKGRLFNELLQNPPKDVDVLLLEGTTLGQEHNRTSECKSETDLEERFVEHFRKAKGMVLVCASGQNIDRLVTIYRACLRSDKQFIVDMYTAAILEATGNDRIPHLGHTNYRAFLPEYMKYKVIKTKNFALTDRHRPCRIYPEDFPREANRSVMLFRFRMAPEIAGLEIGMLIYSLWSGYLETEDGLKLKEWLNVLGIPMGYCHTSGHAPREALLDFRNAFPNSSVVPIHTQCPERYSELFKNVVLLEDKHTKEI